MMKRFFPLLLTTVIAVSTLLSCERKSLVYHSSDDPAISLLGIGGINSFFGTAVTIEQAVSQTDPTNLTPVVFTIVFAEAVDPSTFDDTDIIQNGTASGITWFLSTTDNMTWMLEATVITNPGTLVPSIAAGTVKDIYGNDNRTSTSIDNSVEYDVTAPSVTINQAAAQSDPVNALPIDFTVVFSEAIDPSTFSAADISQGGSATGITWILSTSDNITWTLSATAVITPGTPGTLIPSIAMNMVQDRAGNFNVASVSSDNSVIYDIQAPVVSNFSGPSTTAASNIGVLPTASDNVGITGWMITETAAAPLAGDAGWLGTQPTAYTLSGGPGAYWAYLWVKDGAGNVSVLNTNSYFLITYQSTYAAQVLRTGQTGCHDESGASVSCAGTGQDGELRMGLAWPSPRFTNNGLTVTDNLTGLVWTTNANLMGTAPYSSIDVDGVVDGLVFWQTALNFAAQLRSDTYGGRSDWRLPNIIELMSIMNYGSGLIQAWFSSFGITYPSGTVGYWSSTSSQVSAGNAWMFRHYSSANGYAGKTANVFYAWAVAGTSTVLPRTTQTSCYTAAGVVTPCAGTGQDGEYQAGVAWVPATRFTNNGDGTITDDLTGLMWAENANEMAFSYPGFDADGTAGDGQVTWQHALDYVDMLNSVNYCGYNDWRLPNVNELISLHNFGDDTSWLTDSGFLNLSSMYRFWSSTTREMTGWGASAKDVNNVLGQLQYDTKTVTSKNTWPVRGGN